MARLGLAGAGSAMGTTAVDVPRSIIDQQDELKSWPDARLMEELQAPSGTSPQFLVFSEVKRRKEVRDRYAQEAAQAPETSMVQETIMESSDPYGSVPPSPGMRANLPMAPEQAGLGAIRGMRNGGPVRGLVEGGPVDEEEEEWGFWDYADPGGRLDVGGSVEERYGPMAGEIASGAWDVVRPDATDLALLGLTATGVGAGLGVPAYLGRKLYKGGRAAWKGFPRLYDLYKRGLGKGVDVLTPQKLRGSAPPVSRPGVRHGAPGRVSAKESSKVFEEAARLSRLGSKAQRAALGGGLGYALAKGLSGDEEEMSELERAVREGAQAIPKDVPESAAALPGVGVGGEPPPGGIPTGASPDSMAELEGLVAELEAPPDRSGRNAQALFQAASAFLTQPTIAMALADASSGLGVLVGEREKGDEARRLSRIKAQIGLEQIKAQDRREELRQKGQYRREKMRQEEYTKRAGITASERAKRSAFEGMMKQPHINVLMRKLKVGDLSAREKNEIRKELQSYGIPIETSLDYQEGGLVESGPVVMGKPDWA